MKVVVVGAGKMGLPLACTFADRGADVVACDINPSTVALINQGTAPFEEPGLGELLKRVVTQGRLQARDNTTEAVGECEVCVIIVPVALTPTRGADLSIIESATNDVARGLRRDTLVTYETTVPVGQTRRFAATLEKSGLRSGVDFDLAFSPERVKSQAVLRNLSVNPKVVGGLTPSGAERAVRFYHEYLGAPVIKMESLEAAEFVKLAGMAYRDVNIALANELANYAHAVGLDFHSIRDAANTDGEAHLLRPGIGVGGHCTPVYPHFLLRDGERLSADMSLTSSARRINDSQPAVMLARAGPLEGKRVVILGLGFRPQVKESAYSPAFALRDEISRRRGIPFVNDPLFSVAEIEQLGFREAAVDSAQVVVLNTAHQAYHDLDFVALAKAGVEVVVDGRDIWDGAAIRAAGMRYVAVGKRSAIDGSD